MISGECRVEPIGLSTGHQLALDGLRLRIDLRIVRGTAEDGSAAALWRVEDGRVRTLRLAVPEVYQRAAMLAGVGVVVVALVIWFAGSRAPSDGRVAPTPASPVITRTITPPGDGASAGAGSVHVPSVSVSPTVAPEPPAASAPARGAPAEESGAAGAAAPVSRVERLTLPPRPRPAAARAPAGDNLDLFSDPK